MKRLFAVLAAMLLSLTAATAKPLNGAAEVPGDGTSLLVQPRYFARPEDAVIQFAASVAAGDFNSALDTMADYAKAEKFDLPAMAKRLKTYFVAYDAAYPSGAHEAYVPLNTLIARGNNARSLYIFIASLALGTGIGGSPIALNADGTLTSRSDFTDISLEEFVRRLGPESFQSLRLKWLYAFNGEEFLEDKTQEIIKSSGVPLGYTQIREMLAIYDVNGSLFKHIYSVGLFDSGWQILRFRSNWIDWDISDTSISISPEDAELYAENPEYLLAYYSGD